MSSCIHICSKLLQRNLSYALSRGLCTQSNSVPRSKLDWHLVSAVCLERCPVISKLPSKKEEEYQSFLSQLEYEQSLLSDFELRQKEDLLKQEKKKADDYEEPEGVSTLTAQDMLDAWDNDLNLFSSPDRLTEADKEGDMTSCQRKLDEKLVLIVRQKLGEQSYWILPQGARQNQESMREAAERTLENMCGNKTGAKFIGNAPCGFYKYSYGKAVSDTHGAKVFFFRAQTKDGHIELKERDLSDEYRWVSVEELTDYLPAKYYKAVRNFIQL